MKLYNPTPEKIFCACSGIYYTLMPNQVLNIDHGIGAFLIDKFGLYGLVSIDIPESATDASSFVVRQILTGLNNYYAHLSGLMQNYLDYDTQMKLANEHGTVLTHPNVIELQRKLETANRMIDELQKKHGIVIREDAIASQTNALIDQVEQLVAEAKTDIDRQKKFMAKQSELDRLMNEVLSDVSIKDGVVKSGQSKRQLSASM